MKISIIGAGRLGGLIAFLIADRGLADEIVLLDINQECAEGQVMDLRHSFFNTYVPSRIYSGDYSSITNSDIIIITAGKSRTAQMNSRKDLINENSKIIKEIANEIKSHSKDAILITTTNPVDSINYLLWKETGFDRSKIIGFGGLLDSKRFKTIISEEKGTQTYNVSCDVLGEHGENMVPLFSSVKIRQKLVKFTTAEKERIKERLISASKEIIRKKGATEYGPSSQVLRIVESIVKDKKEILISSCVLNGEYGVKNVSLGVPARIGKTGIEEIEELVLDYDEKKEFLHASQKMCYDFN